MGSTAPDPQDEEHLRLLSICHYVVAGVTAFFGSIPLIHVALGLLFLLAPPPTNQRPGDPPLEVMGAIFLAIGGSIVLFAWTVAILLVLGGRRIARRQSLFFCQVVAGLSCLMVPLGTVLGVFTLIVLGRPSVRALFAAREEDFR